jgi:tetratricopeptide (TPR) repeat protein
MSRSGGDPGSPDSRTPPRAARGAAIAGLLTLGLAAFAAAAFPAAAVGAGPPARSLGGVAINPTAEQELLRLQEQWLRWIGAFYQGDAERAARVTGELLATAGRLGMSRLPDLSLGALARGVGAARDGDFDRARWALAAAERLDPGRPETAFAEATVARLGGRFAGAAAATVRGGWRLLADPADRGLALGDLGLYALFALLAAGLLFLALGMAVHGVSLLADLTRLLPPALPRPVAYGLAVVLLAWPLALPGGGVVALALYGSVLLWGYCAVSERVVLVLLWVVLALAPFALAEQRLRTEAALSPPARALDRLVAGRLYGGLFTDLGVLGSLLPEAPAVLELQADLQRRLGDPEAARALYRRVQQAEPDNADVLLDLGAYYFYKRDYGGAIRYFREAGAARPGNAAAFFALSQAYSESYHFTESRRALEQAQLLDNERVGEWMSAPPTRRIPIFDHGFARVPEIRRALLAARQSTGAGPSRLAQVRRARTVVVMFVLALLAVAVTRARRHFVGAAGEAPPAGAGPGRWRRAALPGLASLRAGEGGRAFAAIALPIALLLLPLGRSVGYRLPLGYDPGAGAAWTLAAAGLAAIFLVRFGLAAREAV